MRNTFGNIFTLTTFGESHGEAVGGIGSESDHYAAQRARPRGAAQWCLPGQDDGNADRFHGPEHKSAIFRL